MKEACCLITITVDKMENAEKLARSVMEASLAACVQIIPNIKSYYWWHGKLERASELMVQFKTTMVLAESLMKYIKENHTYDTPEIFLLKIDNIDPQYEKWLRASVDQNI